MKMSAIASAAAAAQCMASASTSTSSPLRRLGVTGIGDIAKRRTRVGCGNAKGSSGDGPSARDFSRRCNRPAFTSPLPTSPLALSPSRRYFTCEQYKGEELPWTPICETRGSSLHMSSDYGTEGFRDAIRYPPRRGPEEPPPRQQQQQQQRSAPKQQRPQQHQRGQQGSQQQQGQTTRIPFPKLAPGRQRNYRPPHVVSALRVNAELQPQSQPAPPRLSYMEKDYCHALDPDDRDHCLENFRDGRETGHYLTKRASQMDAAVAHNAGTENDYCDALDPAEREHCIESFREGRESTRYLPLKGDKASRATQQAARSNNAAEPRNTDADEDYCDVFADPADREHCLESFRDGRESARYLTVKGGEASRVARQLPQMPLTEPAFSDAVVNGDDVDGRTVAALSNILDEEEADDDKTVRGGRLSLGNLFRDGRSSLRTRSGSDFDILHEPSQDDKEGRSSSSIPELLKDKSSRIFYDGPSSMNFRDGTRSTTFKDKAFSVKRILEVKEGQDEEKEEEEGGVHDGLWGGGAAFGGDDDDDEYNEDVKCNSLIGKAVTTKEGVGKNAQKVTRDAISRKGTMTGSTLLSIDPKTIDIVPLTIAKAAEEGEDPSLEGSIINSISPGGSPSSLSGSRPLKWAELASSGSFVKMFRGSASYIANHRGTLAVYHIPGELLVWEGFPGLMDDIALTWLLGMKIVLVAGCRHQIDLRLEDEEGCKEDRTGGRVMMSSIRVTDGDTLRVVKEEAGFVRFEVERRLARSLGLHGGLVKGSEALVGNVVSGNFYSAQPFGVVDGIDYCWTGFPRKVEVERICQVHETNDIVLLTSLGASPSGEIFNVNSEFLAASVAGAMGASKIVYFNVHGTSFQNGATGKPVQNLRVSDARNLLAHYKMKIHPRGFALVDLDGNSPQQSALRTPGSMETLVKVGYSVAALEKGVQRAHILAPENGALVQELYTRDGCGTLISRDIYEGIRRADVCDVPGIHDLIDPLVRMGTLVERPKSTLEKDIRSYYVYTRDELIVATGQLKRFEGGFAEIGCLVVSRDYRRGGRGDAMLGYLERLSFQCGAQKVFVLSTQTMEWFVERGFREVPVESLPPSRQAVYNKKRKSKIYMKEIEGDRDLDAAELRWSNK